MDSPLCRKAGTGAIGCHAWSASPDYQLCIIYCGRNKSFVPGFNQVSVKPYLGKLTDVNADIIHPQGKIHTLFKSPVPDSMPKYIYREHLPGVLPIIK